MNNKYNKEVQLIVEELGNLENKVTTSEARYILNTLKTVASNMSNLADIVLLNTKEE